MPVNGRSSSTYLHLDRALLCNDLDCMGEPLYRAPRRGSVVGRPQGTQKALQDQARRAHHRTRSTIPTASNKCVTPAVVTPPKMSNAQATSAAIATSNVGASICAPRRLILSVDSREGDSYLT